MSRVLVAGLQSPHPLGATLPALYQEDPIAQGLTAAFDEILAPIFSTLDNLDAYLDPDETPEDFIGWLGHWVGIVVDETWPEDRRRHAVARAARIYRRRGTLRGMRELVEIVSGGTVIVEDNGDRVGWSTENGTPLPGTGEPEVRVRVTVEAPPDLTEAQLEDYLQGIYDSVVAVVRASKPAHVPHHVEVAGI